MPSHERLQGEPGKEGESAFVKAVRFDEETAAKTTYFAMQDTVFKNDWDLSVYRFLLASISHVAVVGDGQPAGVQKAIEGILAPGEPVVLPPHIVSTLLARRAQAKQLGSR